MVDGQTGREIKVAARRGRWAYLAAGHTFVALGVIGAFLPIMPTTVFLIMAASCYARASPALHHKLLAHRTFGPVIRDWQEHRRISTRAKVVAITMIVVTVVGTALLMPSPWIKVFHLGLGVALVVFILRIKGR